MSKWAIFGMYHKTSAPAQVPAVDHDDRERFAPWTALWARALSYLGCLLTGHYVRTLTWPVLEAGEVHTSCIHCHLTGDQLQRSRVMWTAFWCLVLLWLVAGCAPLTVRPPDPRCYIIDIHRDGGGFPDRITERCSDGTHSFRLSHS